MDLLFKNNSLGVAPSPTTTTPSIDEIYGHTPSTPTTPKTPEPSLWEKINTVLDFGQKGANIYTTVKSSSGGSLQPPPPPTSPGMSTGTKVLIGGTVLVVGGIVAWRVFGGKKKKS